VKHINYRQVKEIGHTIPTTAALFVDIKRVVDINRC